MHIHAEQLQSHVTQTGAAFQLQSLQKLNEKNETLPWGKGWQTGRDRNSMSPVLLPLMEKTKLFHCFTEEQIPPDSLEVA